MACISAFGSIFHRRYLMLGAMLNLSCFVKACFFVGAVSIANLGWAQDDVEESEPDPESPSEIAEPATNADGSPVAVQAIYLPLKPPIIVNYGGEGRLRYLKTDISIRVKNADAAHAIRYHMPYVRNNLIMLFAAQTNETVSSQEGRERIRAAALAEVKLLLERENGTPPDDIVDLYFNNFIVQK